MDFALYNVALPIAHRCSPLRWIKIRDHRVVSALTLKSSCMAIQVGGWTASKSTVVLFCTTFDLSDSAYRLNQLRYDLRELKGHGLQRDGSCYAYVSPGRGSGRLLLSQNGYDLARQPLSPLP